METDDGIFGAILANNRRHCLLRCAPAVVIAVIPSIFSTPSSTTPTAASNKTKRGPLLA